MKNLMRCILLAYFLVIAQSVGAQEPAAAETEKLKSEALRLYKDKKYDEALKLARRIVEIKEKALGAQHLEVAAALSDAATIEIAAGKLKNAEKTLLRAMEVFESKPDLGKDDSLAYARLFEVSGFIKYKEEKPEQAIGEYRRALEIKEKFTGGQSLETAKTLWQLANMYLAAGDYRNSYDYYERVVKIRSGNMNWVGYDEVRDAVERYECVANKSGNGQAAGRLIEETEEKIEKHFKQRLFDGGVVNGKAQKLVRPPYPQRARASRISGSVEVQVTIDETGTVIFACAVSGHPFLQATSEEAALGSKFSPTVINGKPVKVSGIIVYNFVPQ